MGIRTWIALGYLCGSLGLAQADMTWTWDPVRLWSNCDPVAIDGYHFVYSTDGGTTYQAFRCPEAQGDPALLKRRCTLTTPYPQGSRCYAVRAFNTALGESSESNKACYTFDKGTVTPALLEVRSAPAPRPTRRSHK